MYKDINIDDKTLPLLANAATPFRYSQVFKSDLFAELMADEAKASMTIPKLAYIMNAQGEGSDLKKLSYEGFIDWLEGFSAMAFVNNAQEIMSVYMGNAEGTAKAKKK